MNCCTGTVYHFFFFFFFCDVTLIISWRQYASCSNLATNRYHVCRHHPRTVLVDPVCAVEHVISRSNVCRVLQQIISSYEHQSSDVLITPPLPHPSMSSEQEPEIEVEILGGGKSAKRPKYAGAETKITFAAATCPCLFSQPKHLIVEDVAQIRALFQASGLVFPVICKPIEACGTPTSHSMVTEG